MLLLLLLLSLSSSSSSSSLPLLLSSSSSSSSSLLSSLSPEVHWFVFHYWYHEHTRLPWFISHISYAFYGVISNACATLCPRCSFVTPTCQNTIEDDQVLIFVTNCQICITLLITFACKKHSSREHKQAYQVKMPTPFIVMVVSYK